MINISTDVFKLGSGLYGDLQASELLTLKELQHRFDGTALNTAEVRAHLRLSVGCGLDFKGGCDASKTLNNITRFLNINSTRGT